jgi:Fic family protein
MDLHSRLANIEKQKTALDKLRPFPPAALARLRDQMVLEWTYNSNAIEGSTLTLKETALVLQDGITVSGKSLREHLEAVNHRDAIQFLESLVKRKEPFNEAALLKLHEIILKGISDSEAGRYRSLRVRILGAPHIPPNPLKVPDLMSGLFAWYAREKKSQNPVVLAATFHHRLVEIHPFIDGNGRSSRLAMNLILMSAGYPPTVILKVDRRKYYRVLAQADQGKTEGFVEFVARSVERSLALYRHSLTPASSRDYEKQGYISLAEAAKGTAHSQAYLSLLARRGKLPAVKFGRNWMTTNDAVREYIESNLGAGRAS